ALYALAGHLLFALMVGTGVKYVNIWFRRNATVSNEESLQPHPDFKDFWPELARHKQPAARSVVGNAIHYGRQRLYGKRRHARFQLRQIDPAGDLTGIQLNDCDSILRQNVGVDLAVD